ncbi:MAG: hypothetical protein B7Y99_00265 [Caulobacterales bacterium 32-69-10]|nr:MAG: hypothetical protein B7Y99_00265 [Caulobacterales bacterium 32-69-10]
MTDLIALITSTADWPVLQAIGESFWWMNLDAAHILTQALTVGTIAIIDLRLLGLAFRKAAVTELSGRILPWTWVGFGGAAATGLLLFVINPGMYVTNRAFWLKIAFMALAAVNMGVFHVLTWRSVGDWDQGRPTPIAAKAAGLLSLTFWICSVASARYIWFPWSTGQP